MSNSHTLTALTLSAAMLATTAQAAPAPEPAKPGTLQKAGAKLDRAVGGLMKRAKDAVSPPNQDILQYCTITALMSDSPKDTTRLITTGTWGTTSFVVTVEKGASSKQIEAALKPDGTPVSVVRTKVEFTSAGLDITVGEGKYPAPATAPAAFPIKYDVIPGVSATAKRPKLPKDASAQTKADVEAAAVTGKLIFACVP